MATGLIVVFRVDASLDIGTGHVMRCLALAGELHGLGLTCRFVCRDHSGNLIGLIRERGYEVKILRSGGSVRPPNIRQTAHAAWLGVDWSTDARESLCAIGPEVAEWLIVDHYALDARWECAVRPGCRRLMVIDDLADRPHNADLLLDQNLGRSAENYGRLVPSTCEVVVGPRYALLRPDFSALRTYSLSRRQNPRLQRLLVSLGGIDKDNITESVLNALQRCSLPANCQITVVMGTTAPWVRRVREVAARMPWPTQVLTGVSDMARLMADSDIAIGAAGVTSWERCCLGVPTMVVVLAGNQWFGARALQSAGAAQLIGDASGVEHLPAAFHALTAGGLEAMVHAAAAITDGHGAQRTAELMYRGVSNG